jgi:hypothetical protein
VKGHHTGSLFDLNKNSFEKKKQIALQLLLLHGIFLMLFGGALEP